MEEKTTMDDFKEELEASFQDTQENDVADITDPAWQTLVQYLEDKTVLTVKIGGIVKSGVVAYVEGIRGFIPASKLSLGYVENLEDWLNKKIQVQVITADPENQKLVLSARELLREKAAEERRSKLASVQVGLVTEGKVESIQPYGAFIDLGNGLSGLVHISQISTQRIKSADQVLHVGDEVDVKVIGIKDGKISLSIKALAEDAEKEQEEELEHVEIPKVEAIGTSLGDLFKNIKL